MENYCIALMASLEQELQSLAMEPDGSVEAYLEAFTFSMAALERLELYVAVEGFRNDATEIAYFKQHKPRFLAKVIYYQQLYRLAVDRPVGSQRALCRYYKSALRQVQEALEVSQAFTRYYRSGATTHDNYLFTRQGVCEVTPHERLSLLPDVPLETTAEHLVATLLAQEALATYLEHALADAKHSSTEAVKRTSSPLRWTGAKVALVELVYALHSSGLVNHGTVPLTELVSVVEGAFGIELGQFHRTFLEIRARKSDRTKFLSYLKDALLNRMDDADA